MERKFNDYVNINSKPFGINIRLTEQINFVTVTNHKSQVVDYILVRLGGCRGFKQIKSISSW